MPKAAEQVPKQSDGVDWYSDLMDLIIDKPSTNTNKRDGPIIVNPPAIPQNGIFNQIDNLIDSLKNNSQHSSSREPVETGNPRLGEESIRYTSDIDIMTNHLKNVISVYPGVSFDIFKSAYDGIYNLNIFYQGRHCDCFIVDAKNMFGLGCPVILNGNLIRFNQAGQMEPWLQIPIPLGSILAMRQMIFRHIPDPDGVYRNFIGVAPEVYNEYMFRLMDQEVYWYADLSSTALPQDEDNYNALGKKILKINAKYPLNARYRMYHYKSNDKFYLISDKLVKRYSLDDNRKPTNTCIEVNGNDLIITEPNNTKKKLITL